MTVELSLDANQQAQIKPILAEQSVKMEVMNEQQKSNKENNAAPTDDKKRVMRQNRMEEKAKMKEQNKQ